MIHDQGSHHKSDESTDRGIEKLFPGMLPKGLQMLAKVPLPKGTALKMLCK
jgi:hypothetical protein